MAHRILNASILSYQSLGGVLWSIVELQRCIQLSLVFKLQLSSVAYRSWTVPQGETYRLSLYTPDRLAVCTSAVRPDVHLDVLFAFFVPCSHYLRGLCWHRAMAARLWIRWRRSAPSGISKASEVWQPKDERHWLYPKNLEVSSGHRFPVPSLMSRPVGSAIRSFSHCAVLARAHGKARTKPIRHLCT